MLRYKPKHIIDSHEKLSCQSVPKKFLVKWEDVAKLVDTWEDKTTLPKRFPKFFFKDKKNLQGKNNMTTLVIQT